MQSELKFLPNVAGKPQGLGDAGIETFRSSPYTSCAREAGQNSRDASTALPVTVRLNLLSVHRAEIPFIEELSDRLQLCLSSAKDEKTRDFFINALKVARAEYIPVLEISDFNTHGLVGPPDDEDSPFVALVKGDGVTNKDDPAAGGSFGIGKNATFAVSDLQTVVYSTIYCDGGDDRFAAQARIRLVSHRGQDGRPYAAEGYWGASEFKAIEAVEAVPSWMRRSELGTSIFAVGFRMEKDWATRMALSIVTNFFTAVDREEMRFEVADGAFKVTKATLESILHDPVIEISAEDVSQTLELERAKVLYRLLTSDAVQVFPFDVASLGRFRLHLLVDRGLPRRVHIIRNGIYITDELRHFGEALRRFPGTREFIAFLEPIADDDHVQAASKALKTMESPEHNSFSPERITDPVKRATALGAMKELGKKIRHIIRSNTAIEDTGETALDELAKYFANLDETKPADKATDEDPDKYVYGEASTPKRRRPRPHASKRGGRTGGAAGRNKGKGGGGGGLGPNEGEKTGGSGEGTGKPLELREVRNVFTGPDRGRSRLIMFTPSEGGASRLKIYAAGLTSETALQLVTAPGSGERINHLTLELQAGERTTVEVHFAHAYEGPLEIAAETAPGAQS